MPTGRESAMDCETWPWLNAIPDGMHCSHVAARQAASFASARPFTSLLIRAAIFRAFAYMGVRQERRHLFRVREATKATLIR